jgi:hypothetical protein
MKPLQRALFAVAASLCLPVGLRAQTLSPEDIYLHAQQAVNALSQPDYVAFTLQDHTQKQHSLDQERLRILVRNSDGHAFVVPMQDAGGNAPHEQPGVAATSFERWTALYRIGDFPLADFGLRKRGSGRPGIFEASGTPQPESADTPGPRVIASVRAVNIPYRIVDLGDSSIDNHSVYHLGLQPRYDAGHHVLREMWIDKASLLPRRYVAERFVGGAIAFRYLVTVNTALVDGHLVNTDADGHFNVNRALLIHYSGEGRWTVSGVLFLRRHRVGYLIPIFMRSIRGKRSRRSKRTSVGVAAARVFVALVISIAFVSPGHNCRRRIAYCFNQRVEPFPHDAWVVSATH